jgi:hypothetical protein
MKDLAAIADRIGEFVSVDDFVEHFDLSEEEVIEIADILKYEARLAFVSADALKCFHALRQIIPVDKQTLTTFANEMFAGRKVQDFTIPQLEQMAREFAMKHGLRVAAGGHQ